MNFKNAKSIIMCHQVIEQNDNLNYLTKNYLGECHIWEKYPKYEMGLWYSLETKGVSIELPFDEVIEFEDKRGCHCLYGLV